jgi:hypothetical protein
MGCCARPTGPVLRHAGWRRGARGRPAPAGFRAEATAAVLAARLASGAQHGGQLAERWVPLRLPAPPGSHGTVLNGVSCPSARSCMAVGDYFTNAGTKSATMALRWSRGGWELQRTPSYGRGLGSFLTGVSCPAMRLCIAVGSHAVSDLGQQPIAERWDGRRWVADPVPCPRGAESYLSAVSCTSVRRASRLADT